MDLSHASEVLNWYKKECKDTKYLGPVEVRPVPAEMTDEERIEWISEHCDLFEYVVRQRKFLIRDSLGNETKEDSFRCAVDMAAEKFRRANGE